MDKDLIGAIPQVHISFSIVSNRTLNLARDYDPMAAWRYLSHHVVRKPQDLLAHTRRIVLCQIPPLTPNLAGALHDMYLILGHVGYDLRARMYEQSEAALPIADRQFFSQWLRDAVKPANAPVWRPGAVLDGADAPGSLDQLVSKLPKANQAPDKILLEARRCIDEGQMDIARQLLEDAILGGTNLPGLEAELLELYRRGCDGDGLRRFSRQLEERGLEFSRVGQELLRSLIAQTRVD